jgi:raffinose/stachyose/melibiose transport system permease protein
MSKNEKIKKPGMIIAFLGLLILTILFLAPIFIVLLNSFKGKFFISEAPFQLPDKETFVSFDNYTSGIEKTNFLHAAGWSFFITVCSVMAIILFTSMSGWFITRVKSRWNSMLYYMYTFSMIVPFQMVMFTMTKVSNELHLDNPPGLIVIYLGFGTGLSVFMFSGFVKSIPIELEEASLIDGCSPPKTFFLVVIPVLKPIYITVGILNTMWIWNDYLLPYLMIGTEYRTIPIAIQYLKGGYGSIDMGAMMAMLVLAIVPIVAFYMFCQKHIIAGVVAGAVKG